MRKMLNETVFKDRLPFEYYLSWPQNPDDEYLIVFVRWTDGDPFDAVPVRLELHRV